MGWSEHDRPSLPPTATTDLLAQIAAASAQLDTAEKQIASGMDGLTEAMVSMIAAQRALVQVCVRVLGLLQGASG